MQDIIWLIYIGLWLAAAWFATRARVSVPRVVEMGRFSYVADQRAMGCMTILFLFMGGAIGAFEPTGIYRLIARDTAPGSWPPGTVDGLGRVAQIVGGLCGAYVGARVVRLWITIFLGWVALQILAYLFSYAVHGS